MLETEDQARRGAPAGEPVPPVDALAERDLEDEVIEEEEDEEGEVSWADIAMIAFVAGMLILNVTGLFPRLFGLDTALIVTLVGGYGIFSDSLGRLLRGKVGGDLAVTIAAFAALAIREYVAAAEVVLIMLVGTALESYAVGRTRGAIAALLKLTPATAVLLRDGREETVPVEGLGAGDRVLVRPGERVPADGTVRRGESAVDQAALTGESLPVPRGPGDAVYAGTFNTLGLLEVEVTAAGAETTLAQIARLVEEAEARKAPVERMADRWAGYFVPTVLALGALTFLLWFAVLRSPLETALTRMAAALIIACPCALILATPTGIAAAIGRAARRGILTRGGVYLERLAGVDCVLFDKTGTLTEGRPEVVEVIGCGGRGRLEVLELAAAAEQGSAHPIASAVLRAAGPGPLRQPDRAHFRPGLGMEAWFEGGAGSAGVPPRVLVGSARLLEEAGIAPPAELRGPAEQMAGRGQTAIFVAAGDEVAGLFAVEDRVRPEAAAVVTAMRALGIRRIEVLSGDAAPAVQSVARRAGIDRFSAGLFPAEKAARIAALQAEGHRVAMVGDGINDAPSLAAADVGIAMGRGAADIAVEAADLVITADDLGRLPEAVVLSRRALRTIRWNIAWFAIGLNGISVLASASGLLTLLGYRLQETWPLLFGSAGKDLSPVLAAVEHQIASLLVVTNSLRLLGGRAWRPGDAPVAAPGAPGGRGARLLRRLSVSRAGRGLAALPAAARRAALPYLPAARRALPPAALCLWAASGLFVVPPGQVGVVQRFGRMRAADIPPGLHYRLPWPAERAILVDTAGVRRLEVGFRSAGPKAGGPAALEWSTTHEGSLVRIVEESLLLTGDEYLVDINLVQQYRVREPAAFLFRSADPIALLREAAESALRRAVGAATLDSLLTAGRADLEAGITRETQAACDRFETGLEVLSTRLQDVHPPQEVVAAYRDVSSAVEEKSTAVNQAEAYRNETIPRARGEAAEAKARADAYTEDRIRKAAGDAGRFSRSLEGYRRGPQVNASRLYLESVEAALSGPNKFVMDPAGGGRRQMWLHDGQRFELPGMGTAQAPPAPREEEEGR